MTTSSVNSRNLRRRTNLMLFFSLAALAMSSSPSSAASAVLSMATPNRTTPQWCARPRPQSHRSRGFHHDGRGDRTRRLVAGARGSVAGGVGGMGSRQSQKEHYSQQATIITAATLVAGVAARGGTAATRRRAGLARSNSGVRAVLSTRALDRRSTRHLHGPVVFPRSDSRPAGPLGCGRHHPTFPRADPTA